MVNVALPSDLPYGFVTATYVIAVGDTTADADTKPDGQPDSGKVTFTPLTIKRVSTISGKTVGVSTKPVVCTLDPATGTLTDTASRVGGVWLIAGQYRVVVEATGDNFVFELLTTHTEAAPADLNLLAPLTPSPAQVFVVNQQVYLDTLAARDQAIAASQSGSGGSTVTSVDNGDGTATLTFS